MEVELTSELVIYAETVHLFDLEIKVRRYLRYHVGHDAKVATDSRERMLRRDL